MAPSLISSFAAENATTVAHAGVRAAHAMLRSRSEKVPFHFDQLEINTPHIIYCCLGGFIVLFGMFSMVLREKLYVGEACWAFIFGIIIGPYGANIFNPREWGASGGEEADEEITNSITLEFTRVVLSIGVFAIGVELPKQYMKRHWKSLAFMLGPIMTWGWFVSAALIYALVPGLNFLSSLAVAACLTPTDPILAAAVVGGRFAEKHVPAHIRHLLAAESGCNDGAAFPFLFLALYLIVDKPDVGGAIRDWFVLLWVYQIILGTLIGALFGIGFRHLMKFCEKHMLIDRHSYVAQYLSLALLTTGVTVLLGSDDLLSTFSCGTAFAWDGFFNKQTEESVFSSVIDLLFNIAAFVYVGAWMPFSSFEDAELTLKVWKLVVLAIGVLVLRRMPIVLALYKWIPDIKTFHEALFTGHFGPIGIGGVFISTLASEFLHGVWRHPESETDQHQLELLEKTIQPIVAFMVLWSIVIHGLSIPSFSLGRRVRSISVSRTWTRERSVGTTEDRRGRNEPEWMDQVRRGPIMGVENEKVEEGGADGRPTIPLTTSDSPSSASSTTHGNGNGTHGVKVEDYALSPSSSDPEKQKQAEEAKTEMAADTLGEKTLEKEKARVGEEGDEEKMKEENPPDGEEGVEIWDEGPHRVIERKRGPGEEVEVQVIRNYNVSSRPNEVSYLHSLNADSVKKHVKSYIHHLEDEASELEKELLGKVHHKPKHALTDKEKEEQRRKRESLTGSGSGSGSSGEDSGDVVETESEGDVDEGWEDQPAAGRGHAKQRSGRNGKRVPPKLGSPMQRRRSSHSSGTSGMMKKALMARLGGGGKPSVSSSPPSSSSPPAPSLSIDTSASQSQEAGSPEEEDSRGRRTEKSTSRSGKPKKAHKRVDSLKVPDSPAVGRSRDASPARSIRFADERTGLVGTPTRITFEDEKESGERS